MGRVNEEVLGLARIIWDYHQLGHQPVPAEFIVALGTNDLRVAEFAADLYLRGYGSTLDDVLPVSKSTISYHIKALKTVGLLTVRKDGRWYHYTLQRDRLEAVLPGFFELLPALSPKTGPASPG